MYKRQVREHVDIRIHTLLRPRFGDFCYTDYEHEMLKKEVKMFRELGADGVVIGALRPDGSLHTEPVSYTHLPDLLGVKGA